MKYFQRIGLDFFLSKVHQDVGKEQAAKSLLWLSEKVKIRIVLHDI